MKQMIRELRTVYRQSRKVMAALLIFLLTSGQLSCSGGNTTTGNPGSVALKVQGTAPNSLASTNVSNKALNDKLVAGGEYHQQAVSTLSTEVDVIDTDGSTAATITITDARVALKEIKFEFTSGAEEDDGEFDFEGPFVVDLLNNTVSPSIAEAEIPFGLYQEVKLKLHKVDGTEVDDGNSPIIAPSDALFEKSIVIEGTYNGPTANSGNGSFDFSFSYDLSETFELTGASFSNGVLIDSEVVNEIIIAFRMVKWFKFDNSETNSDGLKPEDLVVSGGVITLDENSTGDNEEIRDIIRENIKLSADYGEDDDGDGVLDEDEDDDDDDDDDDD